MVLLANALSWILLLCVSHLSCFSSEALPAGNSPKGSRWEASGSEDDSDSIERAHISPEHQVYMRLTSSKQQINRNLHKKPPTYVRRGKLFNRNGYLLRINRDGTVDGTTNSYSPLGDLEFHSIGTGLLMILGLTSQRYLSFSEKGVLRGIEEPSLNSVFKEVQEENTYHSFLLYKNTKWLVGIKKNGRAKGGSLTRVGQKSTQFIVDYN
ncbi:fibroblast growth factor 1-like isoform X2 [Stylophora pistillata]|uniref:fibroblast growth factor 1-like isoform X2 n=1 Tax=Stylophora pistillata TaxID=50429 RepID=UPI000C03A055|nr:fibroblast growth factor 1-like isoform X2 [Stylophora pistillata]